MLATDKLRREREQARKVERARKKLVKAVDLLHEAEELLNHNNHAHYPKGLNGDNVRKLAHRVHGAIIFKNLEAFK